MAEAIVTQLVNRPDSRRAWFADLWRHREVLLMLAQKDFKTRYKRASLGVVWAVVVPVIQASIMAVVFSHVVRTGGGRHFAVYVMSGVIAFSYFSVVLASAPTAIVDGATLTEKVWFPRGILVIVPVLSNLFALLVTIVVLFAVMPVLSAPIHAQIVLLTPAVLLLVTLTLSISLVLAALHVYFRDVRFLVQAALLVWIYVTPILYPASLLKHFGPYLKFNPLTGVVTLFQMATVGARGPWVVPVVITIAVTAVLLLAGLEAQRRHDRLFVDLL